MTLATHADGEVWAAAVFYANDAFDLFFISAAHTRHARYLSANPHAAATIQEDYRTWRDIKGIQLEGAVRQLEGQERQLAMTLYFAKYPYVASGAEEQLAAALARMNWYRLTPSRLYYIDNSKGLGHREEVRPPR